MKLTDVAVRTAKAGERPVKLFDGGGLHVLVKPEGSKLWRLKYRWNGKEKLLSLGSYPAVGLKAARAEREAAKALLATGRDPSAERRAFKQQRRDADATSFAAVAREVLEKLEREGKAEATLKKAAWLIKMSNASLGGRPIASIGAREVLAALKPIEAAGQYETARRLRAMVSRVFRHAVATGRAEHDPTYALRDALVRPKPKHRAAITDPDELQRLYAAIDAYSGQPTTRAGLKLLALLVPRPGELRQARWDEFDLGTATWSVPAERMKLRRPFRIPLPKAAIDVLRGLHCLTGAGELVLPSLRSSRRPLSENTLNIALRNMGYSADQMTSHGFRASFSTIANESGLWSEDAIERQLTHVDKNAVRRAYARGEYWDERIKMMEWWSTQLAN